MTAATKRKRTPYEIGAAYERLVKKKLEDRGYFVVKVGGSKGPVDLLAVPRMAAKAPGSPPNAQKSEVGRRSRGSSPRPLESLTGVLAVQCKKHGKLGPDDRAVLLRVADRYNLIPILAEGVKPVKFWLVTEVKARGKELGL